MTTDLLNAEKLPKHTANLDGYYWSPNMICSYHKTSLVTFYRLIKAGHTPLAILTKPHLTNKMRKFSDRSEQIRIGQRTWTLALIYYHCYASGGFIEDLDYNLFVRKVRSNPEYYVRQTTLQRVEALMMSRRLPNIIQDLQKVSDEQFARYKERYIDFITFNRKKETVYYEEIENPNDKYLEYVADEPKLARFFIQKVLDTLADAEQRVKAVQEKLDKQVLDNLQLRERLSELERALYGKDFVDTTRLAKIK